MQENLEEMFIRKSPKKTIFRGNMRRDSLTANEYKSPDRKVVLSKLAKLTTPKTTLPDILCK